MQRRDLLRLSTGVAALSMPRVARAQRERTLRFVPIIGLAALDPSTGGFPARSHGYLVFDTLYGLDSTFAARPQMIEGQTIQNNGTVWDLRLREGLRFHDASPVLARDAVASIRRWAARDGFGQALMAATGELTAPDDRTIRFHLTKLFPHLPLALAGSTQNTPVVMPERLANADPSKPIGEMVGSGPYRFISSEFVMGDRSAYERFAGYVPRSEGTSSYTAGPKIAHMDRVEWKTLDDASTAATALRLGEVDWVQAVSADQIPLLARDSGLRVDVTEPAGSIGVMRFNHLHPPFDNPAIRRALLGAIDQSDAMNALAGTDRSYWRDRVGLFHYGTPLANETGIEVLAGPRDYDTVKRELTQAGYRGERIVVLGTSGTGYIPVLSQIGADMLRRVGMNVDLQLTDFTTLVRRYARTDAPDKGGWNLYFGILEGAFTNNLATNPYIRGDGKSGLPGWPKSSGFEALRQDWLDTADPAKQKQIAVEAQLQLWHDVPYIPMGQWLRVTAYRRDLANVPWGFAAFYGVRRA